MTSALDLPLAIADAAVAACRIEAAEKLSGWGRLGHVRGWGVRWCFSFVMSG